MSTDQPKNKRMKIEKSNVKKDNKLKKVIFQKSESYTGDPRLDFYIERNKNNPNYNKGYATLAGEVSDLDKLKAYDGVKVRSTIHDVDTNTWIVTLNVNHSQLMSLSKEEWVIQLQSPTPVYPI